jgi:two-component system chemotaxis response regulator CheY
MEKTMLYILVVDDSRCQRCLIADLLEPHGRCVQARDGVEAVERARHMLDAGIVPDLIVMDILMPEMNGHKALQKILKMQQDRGVQPQERSRAVMLSSLSDPRNMMEAQYENGADYYLTKPVSAQALEEVLRSLGILDNPLPDDEGDPCIPL